MISTFDEGPRYPRRDTCRYCGEELGWIMQPMGERVALGVCDKPECLNKHRQESHKKQITGGPDVGG